ncbi:beta-1,4-glucuronyltransferase 1-like isoform X2 [Dreissena polymorpha]|uniref:Beta-1,4-glucuronyltransferase 1 n=2 Tax=Dreissena polymorpha TaxID=45954 RepID=A0A9D4L5E6_DREPO|nr:beta-1,4-glucuronyltransferase 1-like isoform X2 [Dreissena polymorpha]KAH3851583.1 hypothetical protein DPMN_094065 [Dreissena polymorpha]
MRKRCRLKYMVMLLGVVGIIVLFEILQKWRLEVIDQQLNVVLSGRKEQSETALQGIQADRLRLIKKVLKTNYLDSTKEYVFVQNILSRSMSGNGSHVLTICMHATANHLHYLTDLMAVWTGPVSVTVFTHHGQDITDLLENLLYYKHCFENISKFVSFHIAYPVSISIEVKPSNVWNFECEMEPEHLIRNDSSNFKSKVPYPHNVLRNIAITFAKTPYILSLDIDMIPSVNLHSQFEQFVKRRQSLLSDMSSKVAFVLPAFESSAPVSVFNKGKLLDHWKRNLVRPFYQFACRDCHSNTDYDLWEKLPSISFLDIGYNAVFERPWEPFFIARKQDMPLYDGRFKQYGFNRFSQICEMHMLGYSFAVMNNAFVIHRGFKEPESFHETKDLEHRQNELVFKEFEAELKLRYQGSGRNC